MKESSIWYGQSIDRQSMIDKIYEMIPRNNYSINLWFDILFIWDVLDWLVQWQVKRISTEWVFIIWDWYAKPYIDKVLWEWEYLRKPIEEQSDDCVRYIYKLVSE